MLSFLFWRCHHIYYNYVKKPVFLKNSCFSLHYPETHFQSFLICPYQVAFDVLYKRKGELYFRSKFKWLLHICCFWGCRWDGSEACMMCWVVRITAPPHALLHRHCKIPQLGKLYDLAPLFQIELLTQEVPSSIPKVSAKMTVVTNISFKQPLKRNPYLSSWLVSALKCEH